VNGFIDHLGEQHRNLVESVDVYMEHWYDPDEKHEETLAELKRLLDLRRLHMNLQADTAADKQAEWDFSEVMETRLWGTAIHVEITML
jgi:hypothetical protein